jgi:amino acid transporter
MQSLGEMATWLLVPGAIPQFCARYVDDALGFAVGWNNWYFCAIALCLKIDAAAVIIGYLEGARSINVRFSSQKINGNANCTLACCLDFSAHCTCTLPLKVFAVRIYGEAEFIFASIKIIAIIGILILTVCIDLRGTQSMTD